MRKHIPRKNNDKNNLRCILLNINDNISTTSADYHISNGRFEALLLALVNKEIISSIDSKLDTSCYCISDIEKYNIWSKSDFYRALEKYVIPFIPLIPQK